MFKTLKMQNKELRKKLKDGVVINARDYFSETTVHGFRYVVEGRNRCEKLFWIVLIITGFIFSGQIIYTSFSGWNETPLQTTIEKVSVPIQDYPFPAVTICDSAQLQMPRRNRWMFVQQILNWIDISSFATDGTDGTPEYDFEFGTITDLIGKMSENLVYNRADFPWKNQQNLGDIIANFNHLLDTWEDLETGNGLSGRVMVQSEGSKVLQRTISRIMKEVFPSLVLNDISFIDILGLLGYDSEEDALSIDDINVEAQQYERAPSYLLPVYSFEEPFGQFRGVDPNNRKKKECNLYYYYQEWINYMYYRDRSSGKPINRRGMRK